MLRLNHYVDSFSPRLGSEVVYVYDDILQWAIACGARCWTSTPPSHQALVRAVPNAMHLRTLADIARMGYDGFGGQPFSLQTYLQMLQILNESDKHEGYTIWIPLLFAWRRH